MYGLHTDQFGNVAIVGREGGLLAALPPGCPESTVAQARSLVTAHNFLEELTTQFPGLIDGESEVNGGDLVEAFGFLRRADNGLFALQGF